MTPPQLISGPFAPLIPDIAVIDGAPFAAAELIGLPIEGIVQRLVRSIETDGSLDAASLSGNTLTFVTTTGRVRLAAEIRALIAECVLAGRRQCSAVAAHAATEAVA